MRATVLMRGCQDARTNARVVGWQVYLAEDPEYHAILQLPPACFWRMNRDGFSEGPPGPTPEEKARIALAGFERRIAGVQSGRAMIPAAVVVPSQTRVVMAPIRATTALLLLLGGCSGPRTTHGRSVDGTVPELTRKSTPKAATLQGGEGQVSIGGEECSPEAEAALERLTRSQASALSPAQANKDVALLTMRCTAGEAAVCNGLGVVYGEGHGVEADLAKAIVLFRRACDGGNARGCELGSAEACKAAKR